MKHPVHKLIASLGKQPDVREVIDISSDLDILRADKEVVEEQKLINEEVEKLKQRSKRVHRKFWVTVRTKYPQAKEYHCTLVMDKKRIMVLDEAANCNFECETCKECD